MPGGGVVVSTNSGEVRILSATGRPQRTLTLNVGHCLTHPIPFSTGEVLIREQFARESCRDDGEVSPDVNFIFSRIVWSGKPAIRRRVFGGRANKVKLRRAVFPSSDQLYGIGRVSDRHDGIVHLSENANADWERPYRDFDVPVRDAESRRFTGHHIHASEQAIYGDVVDNRHTRCTFWIRLGYDSSNPTATSWTEHEPCNPFTPQIAFRNNELLSIAPVDNLGEIGMGLGRTIRRVDNRDLSLQGTVASARSGAAFSRGSFAVGADGNIYAVEVTPRDGDDRYDLVGFDAAGDVLFQTRIREIREQNVRSASIAAVGEAVVYVEGKTEDLKFVRAYGSRR